MSDKMAISAHILKIVENEPSLTLFMRGGSLGSGPDPPKVFVHNSQSFCDNSLKSGDFS